MRDGDPLRYGGWGVRAAVANVNDEIGRSITPGGWAPIRSTLDRMLIELDGTADKSRLGANAILSVSLAVARAAAIQRGIPLYQHFADVIGRDDGDPRIPRPTVNLFSGGKHAGGQIPIQDILITPLTASTPADAMAQISAVYQSAVELCRVKYEMRALVADEGGLAPDFPTVDLALGDAVAAIEGAGLKPGEDIALCVDVAASHFFRSGAYLLDDHALTSSEMIEVIAGWVDSFPIVSIEDALAEDDWQSWPVLTRRLRDHVLILGDDLLTTNPARIQRAIETQAATALLLKVNQIGTPDRGRGGASPGPDCRLVCRGQRPLRRNGGFLADGPGDRLGRRSVESRFDHQIRATGQMESPPDHRRRARLGPRPVAPLSAPSDLLIDPSRMRNGRSN